MRACAINTYTAYRAIKEHSLPKAAYASDQKAGNHLPSGQVSTVLSRDKTEHGNTQSITCKLKT